MDQIDNFRKAVNDDESMQEELVAMGVDLNVPEFAATKGFNFTEEEYATYLDSNINGELSEFEASMVAGGNNGCPSRGHRS